jgi:uncharacterized LabA/DUF88 family protein
MSHRDERLALFIDGANLDSSVKALGFSVDFKRLRKHFMGKGHLIGAHYYTATVTEPDGEIRKKPLFDWLDYNGYRMVTKPAKYQTNSLGEQNIKGNMDIELAVDAMELALRGRLDRAVIFSGDGDFEALVKALQRAGTHVTVVSTIRSQPNKMIADELRRAADEFIDLNDIKDEIIDHKKQERRSLRQSSE